MIRYISTIQTADAEPLGPWLAHHKLNFWTGCDKVAPECAHCYISRALFRNDPFGAVYRTKPEQWKKASRWQQELERPRLFEGKLAYRVFTCSVSDFFHTRADEWRPEAWEIIRNTPSLVWLVLTKRPERIAEHLPPDWGSGYSNVWLGVSTGCRQTLNKMDTLRGIPAALRWVSAEPLLEDVSAEINLEGFGWVATGGESGSSPGRRVMNIAWAARLRDRVKAAGLPFLFKQVTAEHSSVGANALGKLWREFPDAPHGLTWAPRSEIPPRPPFIWTPAQIRRLWEVQGANKALCDIKDLSGG